MPRVTILRFLTQSGLGSRRKMAEVLKQGRIKVNDLPVEDFSYVVNPEEDSITYDGQEVTRTGFDTICLMLNKPAGVITTTHDEKGRRSVLDIIPAKYKSVPLHPVGRLDRDSTGLLLITNDGHLTNELTHPRFEHEKEYLVAIRGSLSPKQIRQLSTGIELDDGPTWPASVKPVKNKLPFNYSIVIHEGRNRQVRRMFASVGHSVKALKRIRIGTLRLGNLKEGAIREVSSKEIEELLQTAR